MVQLGVHSVWRTITRLSGRNRAIRRVICWSVRITQLRGHSWIVSNRSGRDRTDKRRSDGVFLEIGLSFNVRIVRLFFEGHFMSKIFVFSFIPVVSILSVSVFFLKLSRQVIVLVFMRIFVFGEIGLEMIIREGFEDKLIFIGKGKGRLEEFLGEGLSWMCLG